MPMTGSIGNRISEFHQGSRYAKQKAKKGKKAADRMAVAAAMNSSRREGTTIGAMHRTAGKKAR